jgi:hypothetical protein
MDLGRASDIVTDSLTAMGMGVQDLERFNDVLVGTITRSNTNIEMMGESLKYAAPIASQLGYEIEPLAAMIGTLANAGIKASDAGTDLRQAMVKNKKAAEELDTAETDLIGTLRAARAAGWGVNEITEKYGLIASKSVLVLMSQLDAYDQLERQLHDVAGETDKLAKTKLDTLTGDFKTLKSAIEAVGIEAYESIKGDLRGGVQDLTEYVREHKQDIVEFAESANELAGNLATIGEHAATLFANTLRGWNSLPTVVQEIGIVGAIFGGAEGRLALLAVIELAGLARQHIDDLIVSGGGIQQAFTPGPMATELEAAEAKLVELNRLKAEFLDAGGYTRKQLGGMAYLERIQDQIDDHIDLIDDLKEKQAELAAVKPPTAPLPVVSPPTGDGAPETGSADEIAKAYLSAYSQLDTINQATYDAMLARYKAERDAFVETTGDKQTAYALYAQKVEALNERMAPPETTDEIAEQIKALQQQAEMFGLSAKAAGLHRLELEGATPGQLEQARTIYKTIDALKAQAEAEQETENLRAEGADVTASMRTEAERLADELERLKELYDAGAISAETYNRAVEAAKSKLSDAGEEDDYWSNYLDSMEDRLLNFDELAGNTLDNLASRFGSFFESAIFDSENLGDAFASMAEGMARSMVGAIGEMIAQWLVYQAVRAVVGKTAAAGGAAAMATNAQAGVMMAGINAYSSTAAIPIVGPALAPAAMAAALAATEPMAATVAALSTAAVGMAHEGIDSVPKSGTWLLEQGERVTTAETSAKLDRTLNNVQSSLSGAGNSAGGAAAASPMNVNVYEAAGTSATVRQSNDGQSLDVIIEQVEQTITGRMDRGTGVAGYFDRRYGRRI